MTASLGTPPQSWEQLQRERLLFALASSMGCLAVVTVKSGTRYEGIFSTATLQPDLSVALHQARSLDPAAARVPPATLIFPPGDVVDVVVKKHALSQKGFLPDAALAAAPSTFRTLQKWDGGEGEELGFAEAPGQWDQFAANESQFGVTTDFDENLYTTKLDTSGADFHARMREAERIAAEISGTQSQNIHMQEERGQAIADGGLNEEARYGAVLRGPAPRGGMGRPAPPALPLPMPAAGPKGAAPAINFAAKAKMAAQDKDKAKPDREGVKKAEPAAVPRAASAADALRAKTDKPEGKADGKGEAKGKGKPADAKGAKSPEPKAGAAKSPEPKAVSAKTAPVKKDAGPPAATPAKPAGSPAPKEGPAGGAKAEKSLRDIVSSFTEFVPTFTMPEPEAMPEPAAEFVDPRPRKSSVFHPAAAPFVPTYDTPDESMGLPADHMDMPEPEGAAGVGFTPNAHAAEFTPNAEAAEFVPGGFVPGMGPGHHPHPGPYMHQRGGRRGSQGRYGPRQPYRMMSMEGDMMGMEMMMGVMPGGGYAMPPHYPGQGEMMMMPGPVMVPHQMVPPSMVPGPGGMMKPMRGPGLPHGPGSGPMPPHGPPADKGRPGPNTGGDGKSKPTEEVVAKGPEA